MISLCCSSIRRFQVWIFKYVLLLFIARTEPVFAEMARRLTDGLARVAWLSFFSHRVLPVGRHLLPDDRSAQG
jgi:hypothetical protein